MISHGRATEFWKLELMDLYDKLGYSYLDMTVDDWDDELNPFRKFKKKNAV